NREVLYNLLLAHQECGSLDKIISDFYQGRNPLSYDAGTNNNLAWLLATAPSPDIRNGSWAVLLAEKACKATEYENLRFLDTLAAAYAETGQFEEARRVAQEAIEKASIGKREPRAQELKRHLKMYEAHRPYREAVRIFLK
ncbi:unnamed protein product, partial [marine sediment metagenome]